MHATHRTPLVFKHGHDRVRNVLPFLSLFRRRREISSLLFRAPPPALGYSRPLGRVQFLPPLPHHEGIEPFRPADGLLCFFSPPLLFSRPSPDDPLSECLLSAFFFFWGLHASDPWPPFPQPDNPFATRKRSFLVDFWTLVPPDEASTQSICVSLHLVFFFTLQIESPF